MIKTLLHPRNQGQGHVFRLRGILVFLVLFSLLPAVSCKKKEGTHPPGQEKDPGIHERFERGPATLSMDIDRKEITIAERLNLTISLVVDEDYEIKLPGFGEKLEQFGIVDYQTTPPELTEDNRKKISRSYVLEPFLSGDYTIPPMEVRFWKKGEPEEEAHKIETTEVTITVRSLLPEDLKEARLNEIKPPVPFPGSYILWLWLGIGAGILVMGMVGTTLLIRKQKKRGGEALSPRVPAHELAYKEIKRLVAEDLIQKGEIKPFYQRLSGILRRYIENRFGLRAPEQTTEEFLTGLEAARDFPDKYRPLLKTFLRHCDLVKFAEYQPRTEDIQKAFDSCKAFIQGTEERE